MQILIVDDEESGRVLLKRLLLKCGYEVVIASSGFDALDKVLSQSPDMIISDVRMPYMDGFELCHRCRQDDRLKDIPFILYSASDITREDEEHAQALGVKAFLVKPKANHVLNQLIKSETKPLDPAGLIDLLKNN